MEESARSPGLVRFGNYEVDLRAGELRKHGLTIKLHGQPIEVLVMLLEHPGDLVTREELRKRLWPEDTFVDFDHSLNTAVNKIREALGDTAENPRYVETLPRRGYRFIYPVAAMSSSPVGGGDAAATAQADVGAGLAPPTRAPQAAPLQKRWIVAVAVVAGVAIVTALLALNVAGLRDRIVGAGSARPREGKALPYPRIESIAVLPLENLSGDKEQEYFADGMTDELITNLGKISALRVISRTSAMHYKGTKKRLPEIAKELNVDAIVEGTVQRSGDRVRITANLLHAPTDRHLWAESYERDLTDVLTLQSEMAQAVAQAIGSALTPVQQNSLAAPKKVNPAAYEAYLRGRVPVIRGDAEGHREAKGWAEKSIALDPSFAQGHLLLALAYLELGGWGEMPRVEAWTKAEAEAERAVALESTPQARCTLWFVRCLLRPELTPEFVRTLHDALSADPSNPYFHEYRAEWLTLKGRHDEAIAHARKAHELDPFTAGFDMLLIYTYIYAHRLDDAEQLCTSFAARHPDQNVAFWLSECRITLLDARGDYRGALRLLERTPEEKSLLGAYFYARLGRGREARRIVAENERQYGPESNDALHFALVLATLGERDRAFEWIEKAFEERDPLLWLFLGHPHWDQIRDDPRFQWAIKRRLGEVKGPYVPSQGK